MAKSAHQELRDFIWHRFSWGHHGMSHKEEIDQFMKLLDNYIQSKINNHTHPELWVFGNDGRY